MTSMTSPRPVVIVGVDTLADVHHAAVIDQVGRPLADAGFPTTPAGYRQLLAWAAGDNPDRLHSEAAFAQLCGVAPLPASSGRTRRHRLDRGGDRQANHALHVIALTRLRSHEQSRAYADRRRAEGLSTREILRCLKRYIAREIHHILAA